MPAITTPFKEMFTEQSEVDAPIKLTKREAKSGVKRQAHPVLLIPGAFTGYWLWEDNFLEDFANLGFDTYAMSFRGHGESRFKHGFNSLKDHLSDLERVVETLPSRPIMIGYSLGGLVMHRFLEKFNAPAAFMLSAVPPDGLSRSILDLSLRDPISAAKMVGLVALPAVRHLGSPPRGIYSSTISPERAAIATKALRAEPIRALAEAFYPSRRQVKAPLDTPLKLYGAEGDYIIPAKEVRRSAELLNAPCRIFEGMSHSLMLENDAHLILDDMLDFLKKRSLYE